MAENWYAGNAKCDGEDRRGWLIGHFIDDPGDIRATEDVEIKWGIHPAGDQRPTWVKDEHRTTAVFLVRGRFVIHVDAKSVVLENEGDFVIWGAGVKHSWHAEVDSVVVTVRWPSTTK